jgi:hypothetical protein
MPNAANWTLTHAFTELAHSLPTYNHRAHTIITSNSGDDRGDGVWYPTPARVCACFGKPFRFSPATRLQNRAPIIADLWKVAGRYLPDDK